MKFKLILKVIDGVEIWADEVCYMVKIDTNPPAYYTDLPMCFQEIFEQVLQHRLMENEKKTIDEILSIVKDTKKLVENQWRDADKHLLSLPRT